MKYEYEIIRIWHNLNDSKFHKKGGATVDAPCAVARPDAVPLKHFIKKGEHPWTPLAVARPDAVPLSVFL
jgi:hypothetical protein